MAHKRKRRAPKKVKVSQRKVLRAVKYANEPDPLKSDVDQFIRDFSSAIKSLAELGCSRSELEDRFALLVPATSSQVVRQGIDALDLIFNLDVQVFNFSNSVIAEALWFAVGRDLNLDPNPNFAIASIDYPVARELSSVLRLKGLSAEDVASIVLIVSAAKELAAKSEALILTKVAYERCRSEALKEFGSSSRKGLAPWPPTSQTVIKRLGSGFWSDAVQAVGLNAGNHGRERGLLVFSAEDYDKAISDYQTHASAVGPNDTYAGYATWVEAEERAGRRRPSSASVRLRFKNWTNAKRGRIPGGTLASSRGAGSGGSLIATAGLVNSQSEFGSFVSDSNTRTPVEVSNQIAPFVKSYVEEFENRRREWLREVVALDPAAVTRRLSRPIGLTKAQKRAMVAATPDLKSILPDRYCDNLLRHSDPRNTAGWLRPALQEQLDSISEQSIMSFAVLRALRNFFTHNSAESRQRLTEAISAIATADPRFELRQPVTRRVIIDWLRSDKLKRMTLLTESIPAIWRPMIVVETLGLAE